MQGVGEGGVPGLSATVKGSIFEATSGPTAVTVQVMESRPAIRSVSTILYTDCLASGWPSRSHHYP